MTYDEYLIELQSHLYQLGYDEEIGDLDHPVVEAAYRYELSVATLADAIIRYNKSGQVRKFRLN